MFKGTFTALVTPFNNDEDRSIDWESFTNLLEWQLSSGVDGFVLYGTSGESPTLTTEEKCLLLKKAQEVVKGRIPLIVGAGTNDTKGSLSFIQKLKEYKPDGVLTVAPYYNKPSQEGLYQHFSYLSEKGKLPLVVYNVPSRTSIDISIDTLVRLSKLDYVAGIKQATDSVSNLTELCSRVANDCVVLSGDDPAILYTMLVGGKGTISASANVLPSKISEIINSSIKGDWLKAKDLQCQILPQIKALFMETNPVPAKAVLSLWNVIKSDVTRLPLVQPGDQTKEVLKSLFSSKT